ncbi:unnamed protein product [Tilletia caries]|nr:unnamed protein product [Tilletia caries]
MASQGLAVPGGREALTRDSSTSSMPIDPPEHSPKHHHDDPDNLPRPVRQPTFGDPSLPELGTEQDEKTELQNKFEREQERTSQQAPRIPQGSSAMQSGYSSATMSTDSDVSFDWDDTDSALSDDNDSDVPTSKQLAATGGLGGGRKKNIRARRGRAVYLSCMQLARPVRFALLGFLGTAIALVPFIVAITAFKSNPAYGQIAMWSVWIAIIYSASCATFLVLDFVPSLIMRLAIAVYGRAPEVFKTQVELLTATLFYLKLVLCVAWAWISLGGTLALAFSHQPRPSYFVWVNRTIASLFGTALILFFEKILLQIVAITFHKTAHKDRLQKNLIALKALDRLHESKYINETTFSPPVENESEKTQEQQPSLATAGHKERKAARRAKITQQVQEVISMATMKDSKLYARSRRLGSQQSARKLAKKLFNNLNAASSHSYGGSTFGFGAEKRTFLTADDFVPYFKTEAEAREAFVLFDADGNGDLSKREMREAVQRIYKERRTLSVALKDSSSALGKLDLVLQCIGFAVVVFVWLLVFNKDQTIQNLVPASTFILGFSFVFSNSAKTVFESMVFIFVTHPYDVGDLVCIDDTWMFVKEFGFISTVFRTTTNQEVVAPNALLSSSKYIHNARRSGTQWETVDVQCGFETGLAVIDEFRRRLRAWVRENDREWSGGLDVNYAALEDMNSVTLTIAFEHKVCLS